MHRDVPVRPHRQLWPDHPRPNRDGHRAVQVPALLTGLTGNSTYHFRIVVKSGNEQFIGDDSQFTTTLERALAATGRPAAVSPTAARLIGAVNPKGLSTTVHFEYGQTAAYGTVATADQIPSGFRGGRRWAEIAGLSPGATYHYRIVATSAAGPPVMATTSASRRSPAVVPAMASWTRRRR